LELRLWPGPRDILVQGDKYTRDGNKLLYTTNRLFNATLVFISKKKCNISYNQK